MKYAAFLTVVLLLCGASWLLAAPAPAAGPYRRTAERWLPVFVDGPAQGLHALFSNSVYVARVGMGAHVEIQPLEQGQAVGQPIRLGASHTYSDPKTRRGVGRNVVAFRSPPNPSINPKLLRFEGDLQDGVHFGRGLAFSERAVEAWGWVEDPAGIASPTDYSLSLGFPASHQFSEEVSLEERQTVLAPFALIAKPVSKQPVRYPFAKSVSEYVTPVTRVDLAGPLYGRRKVSVTAVAPGEGPLRLYGYPGFSPWQGFSVILQKRDVANRNRRCQLRLSFD